MNNHSDDNCPPKLPVMESPASYRIHVRGHLDSSWSDRLAGMSITTTGGKNTEQITLFEGQLMDQAALTGVINTLNDLGLPLLVVECIDPLVGRVTRK
jgi:hypothetical protein